MARDIQARQRQVLDGGERLPFMGRDQLDARHQTAMDALGELYGYTEGPKLDSFFANMALSPDLFAGYIDLGSAAALRTTLPVRVRELAILRTSWLLGAPYIWGEHVVAYGKTVLSAGESERITQGSGAPEWQDADRAVLRAAEELHEDAAIAEETWQQLSRHLDARQLLELVAIIGQYTMTAYLQNTLRTRLNAHNPGLTAR